MRLVGAPAPRGADLVAGNTRLRARVPSLLDPARLTRAPELDLPALAADLRTTAYARHLPSDPPQLREAVVAAVEARRRELLAGVGTAYAGPARDLVAVLLARYDLADVLTLLRGAAHDLPDEVVLAAVLGVGAVTVDAARDVVAEDADAVVVRLVTRRLPDPATAAAAARAWERYAVHRDLAELETAVARTAVTGWRALLAASGRVAVPLLRLVEAECDEANLLAALRLRQAGADPATVPERLLPTAALTGRDLREVVEGRDPVDVVPRAWRPAVARVTTSADPGALAALARDLELGRLAAAAVGFRRGDPLGVEVPIGFVARVELEAAALRRAALRASAGAAHEQVPA